MDKGCLPSVCSQTWLNEYYWWQEEEQILVGVHVLGKLPGIPGSAASKAGRGSYVTHSGCLTPDMNDSKKNRERVLVMVNRWGLGEKGRGMGLQLLEVMEDVRCHHSSPSTPTFSWWLHLFTLAVPAAAFTFNDFPIICQHIIPSNESSPSWWLHLFTLAVPTAAFTLNDFPITCLHPNQTTDLLDPDKIRTVLCFNSTTPSSGTALVRQAISLKALLDEGKDFNFCLAPKCYYKLLTG
jgi:hypothetical protein